MKLKITPEQLVSYYFQKIEKFQSGFEYLSIFWCNLMDVAEFRRHVAKFRRQAFVDGGLTDLTVTTL